jgi:hypothetical protein
MRRWWRGSRGPSPAAFAPSFHGRRPTANSTRCWSAGRWRTKVGRSPRGLASLPSAGSFHPAPRSLFYGEAAFGALPYFAPPFLATGNPTLALNLLFFGSVALTAIAIHLVTWRWTASHVAGLVAACTFLTTRWVLWTWTPGAPNYAVVFYLPWIILLASRPSLGPAALAGLGGLVVLQGLVTPYYAVMTLVPLGMLALGRSLRATTRAAGIRMLGMLAAAAVVLALAYRPYLHTRLDNPELATQTAYVAVGWPRSQALSLGTLLSATGPLGVSIAALALVAFGAVLRLARPDGVGRVPRSAWVHATFWAAVGVWLSRPPLVDLAGMTVPLPQYFVWGALTSLVRDVQRLGVAGLVGLSMLSGIAFAECAHRLRSWRPPALGVVGGFAAAFLAWTYGGYADGRMPPGGVPQRSLPKAYPTLAAPAPASGLSVELSRPGGPLLELPAATMRDHARAMYASIFHRRKVLNGYASYWPIGFPERMALVCRLPDPDAVALLREETGLELILVHLGGRAFLDDAGAWLPYGCRTPLGAGRPSQRDVERIAADKRAAWTAAVNGRVRNLELVGRDGTTFLFRVVRPRDA